ncbi:MAG TPA: hypothetical protein VE034_01215 [Burkholderiales bacterium]|nr:hypothetical protein [Burkholderiales bacterium]
MAAKSPSRRAQVAAGLLAVAAGSGLAAFAASHLGRSTGRLDPVVGMMTGLVFAFAGAILVVPERRKRLRVWIGAFMITSIALLFDWLAFSLSEHRATSGLANGNPAARTHFWEVPGRVLLLSGAVLFNLMALWAWLRALWRRKPARA